MTAVPLLPRAEGEGGVRCIRRDEVRGRQEEWRQPVASGGGACERRQRASPHRSRRMPRPLLEVRNLVVRYGKKGAAGRRRRVVHIGARRDPRPRRRVRLGEDDDRPRDPRPAARHERAGPLRGPDITRAQAAQRRALQGDLRAVFQDPFSSLNPRRPIGDAITEPMRVAGVPRAERDRRVKEVWMPSGCARIRGALPAPVLRRPAPAHRDRAGAGHRPAARRLRRGGQRARPLHPGAGAQPARRPARREPTSASSSSRTTWRSSSSSPSASSCSTAVGSWRRGRRSR